MDVFCSLLRKRLAEERETRIRQLADGSAADHTDYRERVAFLNALDLLDEWCQAISLELYGPSPGRE